MEVNAKQYIHKDNIFNSQFLWQRQVKIEQQK